MSPVYIIESAGPKFRREEEGIVRKRVVAYQYSFSHCTIYNKLKSITEATQVGLFGRLTGSRIKIMFVTVSSNLRCHNATERSTFKEAS